MEGFVGILRIKHLIIKKNVCRFQKCIRCLKYTSALRYAPVGIMFLIAAKIVEMQNLAEVSSQLGMYTMSVIVGLLIHGLFVLPLLYFVVTKKNPYTFIGGLLQALITALGTSSR